MNTIFETRDFDDFVTVPCFWRYKWYDQIKMIREVREKNEDHRDWTKWVGKIDPRKEDQRNHRLSATAARPFMAYDRLQHQAKSGSYNNSNHLWRLIIHGSLKETILLHWKED